MNLVMHFFFDDDFDCISSAVWYIDFSFGIKNKLRIIFSKIDVSKSISIKV